MNRLLCALVNGAALSMALTAAVWLLVRIVPRRLLNAATRYAIWWAALSVAVALPAVYLHQGSGAGVGDRGFVSRPPVWQNPRPQSPPLTPVVPYRSAAQPIATAIPHAPAMAPAVPPRPPIFPIHLDAAGWPRWVMALWVLASGCLLFRLLLSCVSLHRIGGRAADAPPRLQARAQSALALCGAARRSVRLAGSAEIAIPAAVGPLAPAILLPAALLDKLDDEDLDRIILHEAAHLARYDDCTLLCERVVEALFWLHPAVRWIARQIDLEREIACDDRVIAATGQARSYASCLTRVVELSGGVRPSLAAAGAADDASHLSRRIDMLLDRTRHTGTRLLKGRLGIAIALVAVLAIAAARVPGLVAFGAPLAHTMQRLPARIAAALPLAAHAAQEPPPAPQEFEGRVIEDSSGNPLPSAEVRFRKAGMHELAADLDTDREGRVRASGLPGGDYTVDVLKPNFVTASLEVRVPSAALLVRLVRYGIISGQVTDSEGRPEPGTIHAPYGRTVGGTRVTVLVKREGGVPLEAVREQELDENGRYRIYDLPPGQYAVGVWYDGLKDGSGFQLYPDNARPRFFTIAGGEDYSGIDFLIAPRATYQVSGRIELPKKDQQFALALGMPDQPALPVAQALTESDGSFRFEKVPIGTYDLFVGGPDTGYGAHESVLGPDPLYGRTRVSVTGQNVEGVSVPLSAGRSVAVVLRGHGTDARPQGCPPGATVGVTALEPWGLLFDNSQTAQATFEKEQTIRNLPPGRFLLSARNLPAGCYQVNQPVADLSGEAAGPVAVELAAAGSIHGVLRAAAGHASDYAVVLLEPGAEAAVQSRLAFPDAQARFDFEGLRPGRYRIAAQPVSETGKARWVGDVSRMVEIDVAGGMPTVVELPAPAKGGAQ